jgi:hypothetical protein
MNEYLRVKLSLPVTCDCGATFKIDAIGLTAETDVICPTCTKIDRFAEDALSAIHHQLMDVIDAEPSEDVAELYWEAMDAEPVKVAQIIQE